MLPLTPPAANDRLGRMMGTKRIKNSNSSCTQSPAYYHRDWHWQRLEDSERSCFTGTIHRDSDSESLRLASNCSFSTVTDFDSGITVRKTQTSNLNDDA